MVPSIYGENMFDDFFDGSFFGGHSPLFGKHARNLMKTDIRETDDAKAYRFAVELPGFEKDEIHVDVQDGYLTVSAEKGLDKDEENKKGRVLRQERYSGACSRSFYVGDVKPDEIAAIAEEILPESRGEVIERDYGQEDMRVVEKFRREAMEVSMPQFLVGFKCSPAADGAALMRQDIIADIACDILLGDSSPLYQRLYDKGLINGSFGGGFDQLPGIAYLYAGGDSDAPETVVRAILDEAQRLAREGVDEAFYQQLRRASFGSTLRALNSFENIAVSVADGAFRDFDPFRFPEVYDSVTRADVETFLRESIVEERSALSILIPKKEGASQ